jgi:hypothetical protein
MGILGGEENISKIGKIGDDTRSAVELDSVFRCIMICRKEATVPYMSGTTLDGNWLRNLTVRQIA